ncbi:MAG: T9SS type A sorting domain-containing protein [Bacteroidetes bacterium]|nr:T9SS type A sorting domain-containing protein [Bacteroidota bacterium]
MKACLTFVLVAVAHCSYAQLVDGYTDKLSYRIGDTVKFYVRGVAGQYSVQDINGIVVDQPITFTNTSQIVNTNEPWKNGYGYVQSAKWRVPALKSGMYFLNAAQQIPIIIKGNNLSAEIVVVCSTNTDQAYNQDDKYHSNGLSYISMYGQTDQTNALVYSPIVSFHRPIKHLDWTDGFLTWFFNNNNYTSINVISDYDLEDYNEIKNAKLVIVIGHSEYWTRQARMNFDKFIEAGSDAMILSGNSMWWQVRYQNDNGNPQMICYRGSYAGYPQNDPGCDPLLETTSYDKPSVKYSIVGSIGGAWPYGGFANDQLNDNKVITEKYQGFDGYKIILPNSPLLAGTNLKQGDILPRNFANGETGELDGTLFTSVNNNSYPVIDPNQMGFYRAEIIGYDLPAYSPQISVPPHYAPIIAFQRTSISGRIVNVNSNYWCRPSHFNNLTVQKITNNMIDLLRTRSNIFDSPVPTGFSMSPYSTAVTYNGCATASINITPNGIFLSAANGYRIDQQSSAEIIDCTTCDRGARTASSQSGATSTMLGPSIELEPTSNELMQVYPNPNVGKFTLSFDLAGQGRQNYYVAIFNIVGELVLTKQIDQNQSSADFDINLNSKGVYFVKLYSDKAFILTKKIIIQ